jgi:hypothetical protein
MNTCEERMERLDKRLNEIKGMNPWDLDNLLATIPPLVCASEIDSPIADAIKPEQIVDPSKNVYVREYPPDEFYSWDAIKKEGLFNVVGYAPIQYVREHVENLVIFKKKLVIVIGEDDDVEELLGSFHRFHTEIGDDLSDHEYAMALRDEIETQPIGAVVLINQEDRLQHVDLITNVQVFRGNRPVATKKIPVFHVHTEQWVWNEEKEQLQLKKEVFEKVVKEIPKQEDDRIGCVQKATDIQVEHRVWLWPGYIGRNRLVHFGGASAEGKSPVTLDIAARASAGLPWPDGTENELGPRSVILLCAEDDWSDTVIPRLKLAGADLNNIYRFFVKQKDMETSPSLDSDCLRLEKQIREIGNIALTVIDPITNYLGKAKMNLEADVRGVLMPLSDVARNNDCAIVTVGHLNKRDKDTAVSQRLMGAAAFGGVARDTFYFGNDPDDADKYAHVMAESRNKSVPKLKYRTESVKVEWGGKSSDVIRVKWLGVSHADIDEVVNAPKAQEKSTMDKAVALVTGMLRSGAKRRVDIEQALKENGINTEKLTFDRLKKRCTAKSRTIPGKSAGWEWYLETKQQQFDEQGATTNE